MNKDMIIKVCGLRDADNIAEVSRLGVDWIGFIFWSESPRYVSQISSHAGIIHDYPLLKKNGQPHSSNRPRHVGVFVDDMPQNIVARVYNYDLDIVQLHGSESPVMIDNLRRTLDPDIRPDIKIMKAISVGSESDVAKYREYEGHVDYFLFDTKTPLVGGSGSKFDWSVLDGYDGQTPFILSGGISPDDVERVRAFDNPRCIGIDVNSKFETSPAVKDIDKLRTFVNAVRQ